MKILLATQNLGKYKEIKRMLEPLGVEVILPEEKLSVEEKGNSFMENAYIKAMAYFEKYRIPTLADDSGLVVPSLGGYPGVFSSRFYSIDWGGREEVQTSEDEANIRKLLRLMKDVSDRRAYFKAVLCLFWKRGCASFPRASVKERSYTVLGAQGALGMTLFSSQSPMKKPWRNYLQRKRTLSPTEAKH
jgi:non-canonical purine NTP pyrophosphatase (RdgB/HAM1 family)